MERLNWAVLGLMGIVTALGLTTSSGAGKAKSETMDSDTQVVVCAPIGADTVISHSGCAHCQAKKDAAANDVAKPADDSSKIEKAFAALIHESGITKIEGFNALGGLHSEEHCPGNCHETGVCCDKSLSKSTVAVAAKTEAHICEGGECPSCKKAIADVAAFDCPLAKAADAITNLTKNYVCEGGDCLTKQGHGTLTITAVDPTSAKPEGLLNLQAAAEAAETAKPASASSGSTGSTIILSGEGLTKVGSGTLTLNIKATDQQPAAAIVQQTTAVEAKPVVDNSRAAARAAKLAKIEAKMEAPWKWEFERVSFEELVEILQVNLNVPVMVDRKAIEEMAYDTASTFKIEKQPEMESAQYLRQKLLEHGLTWVVPASNDCVLITSMSAMENMRHNRVFDVTDLVNDTDFNGDELVQRIESLIEPNTWRASGGPGDVAIWKTEKRLSLISSNNYWVQREVANLIEDLRLDSPKNSDHAAAKTAADPVAVLRRYELPAQPDVKDPLDRHKVLQAQQTFLLSVLKDLPQFNSEVFVATEYNLRPVLVTKQLPEVHNKIKQRLKELAVVRAVFF